MQDKLVPRERAALISTDRTRSTNEYRENVIKIDPIPFGNIRGGQATTVDRYRSIAEIFRRTN